MINLEIFEEKVRHESKKQIGRSIFTCLVLVCQKRLQEARSQEGDKDSSG